MPYQFIPFICLLFVAQMAMASDDEAQIRYLPKHQMVEMGTLITDLRNFDYKKNSFDIIFYVWWNSYDQNYRPDKIIEIINAFAFDHKDNFQTSFEKGIYNTSVRYYATVHHDWDMRNFPFDRQKLKVKLEDGLADIDSVRFIPDLKNSELARELVVQGFDIQTFSIREEPFIYRTNFGNNLIDRATFSRIFLEIDVKRVGIRDFINYFIAFFIGVFLIGLAYLVDPTYMQSKFSLSLSAIFASVSNKYILDGILPIAPFITLSDLIGIFSFIYIMMGATVFTLESILMRTNQILLCKKISYIACAITTSAYVGVIVYVVQAAIYS